MTRVCNRKRALCATFVLGVSFLVLSYHGQTYLTKVDIPVGGNKAKNVIDSIKEQSVSLSPTLAYVHVTKKSVSLSPTLVYVTSAYDVLMHRCKNMDIRTFRESKSSAIYSRITGVTEDKSDMNAIFVHIQTFDQLNRSKTVGGDLLHVIVTSDHVGERVAGHVIDHRDGRYTGVVRFLWTDQVKIQVQIGSALENVCLRLLATDKFGNLAFSQVRAWGIRGHYIGHDEVKEFTPCGPNIDIYGYNNTCNYTQTNDNIPWYCGKPRDVRLLCSDIKAYKCGPFDVSAASQFEKVILPTVETLKNNVSFKHNWDKPYKHSSKTSFEKCSKRSSVYSWREGVDQPSGYWYNSTWNFFNCSSGIRHDPATYRQCLKGKTFYFFGDSTVQQYVVFLFEKVMNFTSKNYVDFKGYHGDYHFRRVFSGQGINVVYFKHAMLFHNPHLPTKGITSIPTEMTILALSDIPDKDLIVFVSYHAHFQEYPISVFVDRISKLVRAVKRLLSVKPRTKVFFKGPHFIHDDMRWFDNRISLLYRDIVRDAFSDLASDVIYLDTWWVTVTHSNTDLHPQGDTFMSLIQQFMTYLC